MKRDRAEEMCRQLAGWAGELDDAVGAVIGSGASQDETHEAQRIVASLMASLYLDVARPATRRFPELDPIFTGPSAEGDE